MINSVTLTGRLTKQPDMRATQSGLSVLNFTIAVNRNYGENEADFIQCVAFKKTAEIIAQYAQKGSLVGIVGRLQVRNYENNEGNRVYVTEVVVNDFSFLESKNQVNPERSTFQPHQQQQSNIIDPFADTGDSIDIDDGSLPF